MSIHVALHHRTSYTYDRLVGLGPQVIRLRPAPHCRTRILSYSLKLTPAKATSSTGNRTRLTTTSRASFYPEKVREFAVEVDLVAEMSVYNPFDFFLEPGAENFPFAYDRRTRRRPRALPAQMRTHAQVRRVRKIPRPEIPAHDRFPRRR